MSEWNLDWRWLYTLDTRLKHSLHPSLLLCVLAAAAALLLFLSIPLFPQALIHPPSASTHPLFPLSFSCFLSIFPSLSSVCPSPSLSLHPSLSPPPLLPLLLHSAVTAQKQNINYRPHKETWAETWQRAGTHTLRYEAWVKTLRCGEVCLFYLPFPPCCSSELREHLRAAEPQLWHWHYLNAAKVDVSKVCHAMFWECVCVKSFLVQRIVHVFFCF